MIHQQLLSGADIRAYWCSNFLFDFIFYIPVVLTTMILVAILGISGVSSEYLIIILVLLMCYAFHALPLAYILSHLFSNSITAQNMTRAFFSLTGVICGLAGGVVLQQQTSGWGATLSTIAFGILPNAAVNFKDWLSWAVFVHRTDMPQKASSADTPTLSYGRSVEHEYPWCWRVRH